MNSAPSLNLWIIPLLPLLGAAINGFAGSRFSKKLVAAIALLFPALALIWAIYAVVRVQFPYQEIHAPWIAISNFQVNFGFALDQLSTVMLMVVTGVGFLITACAAYLFRGVPYGVGMVQLYVEADTNAHYFTFGPEIPDAARRVALFDCVINNTDRKAGHLLRGPDGRVWAIDHGLTFHFAPKLRTVIWDFAGERFAPPRLDDLRRLLDSLEDEDGPLAELRTLLRGRECDALRRRVEQLIHVGRYPQADSYRSMPWPSISLDATRSRLLSYSKCARGTRRFF